MKSKVPLIGVVVGLWLWISLMGCLITEALQAWYIRGEMAAIDRMQEVVVFGLPVTLISFIVGGGIFYIMNDITNKKD